MSPHASWLLVSEIIPRLSSTIPKSVPRVGSDDWEELIQDGTAIAAQILVSAELKGKTPTAGNVAYYTTRLLQAGRRSTGYSNAEVLGAGTQLNRRSSVSSMDEVTTDSEGDGFTLDDLLSGPADDPAVATSRKLDWEGFLSSLDAKTKTLLEWLADGGNLAVLARRWNTSPATVTRRKQELADLVTGYFGDDIATAVAQEPQWRINLRTARERIACRHTRQTA